MHQGRHSNTLTPRLSASQWTHHHPAGCPSFAGWLRLPSRHAGHAGFRSHEAVASVHAFAFLAEVEPVHVHLTFLHRICLIEHCASPALADRASYRDYLGLQTDGERLSRAVAARQKQKPAAGSSGQPSEARGRARAHPSSARGAERKSAEHQARVAWAAGLAFASVTLAGCCLALGVAIGQQHPWQRSRSSQDLAGAETPTRQVPLLSAETPTTPTQRRAPVSF